MNYGELVRAAVKKAYEEQESNTIITKHEGDCQTTTTFYIKNKAIWCKMETGCIKSDNRVYKVNTDAPYIRDLGRYWKLVGQELEIVKRLAKTL